MKVWVASNKGFYSYNLSKIYLLNRVLCYQQFSMKLTVYSILANLLIQPWKLKTSVLWPDKRAYSFIQFSRVWETRWMDKLALLGMFTIHVYNARWVGGLNPLWYQIMKISEGGWSMVKICKRKLWTPPNYLARTNEQNEQTIVLSSHSSATLHTASENRVFVKMNNIGTVTPAEIVTGAKRLIWN